MNASKNADPTWSVDPASDPHADDAPAHDLDGRRVELHDEDDVRVGYATWAQLRASLATHEGWIDAGGVRCFAAGDAGALQDALDAHDEVAS